MSSVRRSRGAETSLLLGCFTFSSSMTYAGGRRACGGSKGAVSSSQLTCWLRESSSLSIVSVAAAALVASLGLWLSYQVVRAVRTGTARVRNDIVHRRKRPVYYWTAVLVQAAFATLALLSVVRMLSR